MGVNYVENAEIRIPTKVKRALADKIATWRLRAALVAAGRGGTGEIDEHFKSFLDIVKRGQPAQKAKDIGARMARPLDSYRVDPSFAAFRNIDLARPDAAKVLSEDDLVTLHRSSIAPLRTEWVHIPGGPGGVVVDSVRGGNVVEPQSEWRGLRFHLHKVKCYDETGSGWGEWGEDEIYAMGVAVDENGNTSGAGQWHVADFDDGDVKVYPDPGRQLQHFNIHEGGDTFPKIYNIAFSLIEHDFGNLKEWYDKFLSAVQSEVSRYLATLVGIAIGSSLGPLGSLIGAAIGWAIGEVIGVIKGWLDDEHLGTATLRATINSYTGTWTDTRAAISGLYTRDFRGDNSHYRIYWRCELVR